MIKDPKSVNTRRDRRDRRDIALESDIVHRIDDIIDQVTVITSFYKGAKFTSTTDPARILEQKIQEVGDA